MTAVFYPDEEAVSENGRYKLEARSPHNGEVPHRDGSIPDDNEFAFKYRQHQSDFCYRLIQRMPLGDESVVWERWQSKHEDSPAELVVSNDGWSVLRTHGFHPEVIVVNPYGHISLRVEVVSEYNDESLRKGQRPEDLDGKIAIWRAATLSWTTAGCYWAGHSHRYFLGHQGKYYFIWRPYQGHPLIIDLDESRIVTESDCAHLNVPLMQAESRWAVDHLHRVEKNLPAIRMLVESQNEHRVDRAEIGALVGDTVTAIHLIGVHRVQEATRLLRVLSEIDYVSYQTGTTAMGSDWWLEGQMWRPILNHALRCIDEKPAGYAPYHFVQYGDSEEETGEEVAWYDEVKVRFPIPDEILDRRDRLLTLTPNLKALEVLGQVGSPDHVRNKYEQIDKSGRWVENWEYDHRINSQWKTFRIRWIEIGGVPTIERLDESPSDWISSDLRVNEILDH